MGTLSNSPLLGSDYALELRVDREVLELDEVSLSIPPSSVRWITHTQLLESHSRLCSYTGSRKEEGGSSPVVVPSWKSTHRETSCPGAGG